jgi:hypothetical protein
MLSLASLIQGSHFTGKDKEGDCHVLPIIYEDDESKEV